MRILHIMFSKQRGGMERVFMDYTRLFALRHEVITLTHSSFPDNAEIAALSHAHHALNPGSVHNMFSRKRLQRFIATIAPDAIIAHGNKPLRLLQKLERKCPLVGVNHSDNIRHSGGVDHLICVNPKIAQRTTDAGILPKKAVTVIPNFIWLEGEHPITPTRQEILTLGALGRFTHEKGMDVLLDALPFLDMPYRVHLGGDGEEMGCLQARAMQLGVLPHVDFLGWQQDIAAFFNNIDVLVVPSRHETFGLVILEAWKHRVPVIATDADGPVSLITHTKTGMLVEKEKPKALADTIMMLAKNDPLYAELCDKGYHRISTSYTHNVIIKKLEDLLEIIVTYNAVVV